MIYEARVATPIKNTLKAAPHEDRKNGERHVPGLYKRNVTAPGEAARLRPLVGYVEKVEMILVQISVQPCDLLLWNGREHDDDASADADSDVRGLLRGPSAV